MIKECFGRVGFRGGETVQCIGVIYSHVEFINRALGGLFQLVTELLGIDRGHLTAPGGEDEKPHKLGLTDVGVLQKLEIRIGGMCLQVMVFLIQPLHIRIGNLDLAPQFGGGEGWCPQDHAGEKS